MEQAARLNDPARQEIDLSGRLVVLDGPTPSAAIVGQVEKRYSCKAGRLVATHRVIDQACEAIV